LKLFSRRVGILHRQRRESSEAVAPPRDLLGELVVGAPRNFRR
jgi:hypothetical protein